MSEAEKEKHLSLRNVFLKTLEGAEKGGGREEGRSGRTFKGRGGGVFTEALSVQKGVGIWLGAK